MIKWIALGIFIALVLLFIFLPAVAWTIVGLVLLIILVVLFVPIGADVSYIKKQFRLAARIDGFAIQLLPKKPPDPNKPPKEKKEEKPKKEQEEKEQKPEAEKKPKKKLNFTKEEIFAIIKKALHGLGKFGKLTVRKFMLHYVAAGEDPYNTAVTFNYVNAALSTLAPICARKFRVVGDVDVRTDVDFAADSTVIEFELSITLRLIQVVRAAFAAGIGVIGVLIQRKRRLKQEAKLAKENGKAPPDTDKQTASADQENNQPDERNDNNG